MTKEEADQLVALNIRRTDRDIDSYISSVVGYVDARLLSELRALPNTDDMTRTEIIRFLGGIESMVFSKELDNLIFDIQEIFDLQYSLAQETFKRSIKKSRLPPLNKRAIDAIRIFAFSKQKTVKESVSRYLNDVREGVVDNILSSRSISDSEILAQAAGKTFTDLKVDLATSISAYSRLVQLSQAKKMKVPYVYYAGPKDERNRPFCAARAQKTFKVEEVYTWDNGQGLPADMYCGGYGCRHELIPTKEPPADEPTV